MIHLKTGTLVAQGEDARGVKSIVDTIGSTGGVNNLEELDGIINMTNTDSPSVLKMSLVALQIVSFPVHCLTSQR